MSIKTSVLLLVLVGGVIMAGCTSSAPGGSEPGSPAGGQPPGDGGAASGSQMVGSEIVGDWNLVSLNGHSLVDDSTITASLDGVQITGSACNSYFADYTIEVGDLSFGNIGSTEKFCEATMDQEQEYFDALSEVNSWSVEGATLELSGETARLVFERNAPASDVNLEGTNWTMESFIIGGDAVSSLMADTAISAVIVDGEISGNATCNDYSGAVSIDGAGITIGQIVMTEMDCEIGMDQESRYLQTLAEVSTWRIDGTTLTLSADNGNGLIFRVQQ